MNDKDGFVEYLKEILNDLKKECKFEYNVIGGERECGVYDTLYPYIENYNIDIVLQFKDYESNINLFSILLDLHNKYTFIKAIEFIKVDKRVIITI